MKASEKVSCLFWTLLFFAAAGASGWFVHRRAPGGAGAFVGAVFGGVILVIALGWLLSIPGRIREWWLIVRARFGGEPADGSRGAVIGTLRALAELEAPLTHTRCALYHYEIFAVVRSGSETSDQKVYEGFAMAPLAIEQGAGDRTRILAEPDIPGLETKHLDDLTANANAKQYIERTHFEPKPAKNAEKEKALGDGHLRYDYRHDPVPDDALAWRFVETVLQPGIDVCAIGEYNAGRRALVAPVSLRRGTSFAIGAAWRVVNGFIGSAICLVIAVAAAAIFCANFPLDAVEQSHPQWQLHWWEIDLERLVSRKVREPMVRAGMLGTTGYYLQELCEGCAKGRLEVNGRVTELRHAAYAGGKSVHMSATPGDRDGVTLNAGENVVLTIDGKSAPVPASWLQPGDVETSLGQGGDYAGRVTVIAPDGWIRCRVYFQARVDADAWLRE